MECGTAETWKEASVSVATGGQVEAERALASSSSSPVNRSEPTIRQIRRNMLKKEYLVRIQRENYESTPEATFINMYVDTSTCIDVSTCIALPRGFCCWMHVLSGSVTTDENASGWTPAKEGGAESMWGREAVLSFSWLAVPVNKHEKCIYCELHLNEEN